MQAWLLGALGGVLIGLSALVLMGGLGRIAGISGIAGGLLHSGSGARGWRIAFVAGLVAAPLLLRWLTPCGDGIGMPQVALPTMAVAGLLVGFGTGIGSGCTSGHGVCGIARWSPRSLLATGLFMTAGIATVFIARHLIGAA